MIFNWGKNRFVMFLCLGKENLKTSVTCRQGTSPEQGIPSWRLKGKQQTPGDGEPKPSLFAGLKSHVG